MNTQKTVTFWQFFKFELRVPLSLLLFAFLVEVFISLIQGVIIWDGYFLLALLFFGVLYLLLGVLFALFSGIAGYLISAGKRTTDLTFFGILFPSTVIAVAYVTEAIYLPIARLFPGVPMGISYGILAIASLLVLSAAWRFWLRKSSPSERSMELLQSGIIFMALAAIWIFSVDVSFIKGSCTWSSRLSFAFAWLGIALFGFPLARIFSRRLTRDLFPSAFSISKRSRLSIAVFLLLAMGYCFLLAKNYNPHSPDKYAIRSHTVSDSTGKPNVFLFILDTFRADQLFDYGEKLAPNLTSLSPECVVFTQAYSPSSWTLPATRAILSSLYPTTAVRVTSRSLLDLRTLAEILAGGGYTTLGFSDNLIATGPVFAQGFDSYDACLRYYVYNNFILFRLLPFLPQRIIHTCLRGSELGTFRLTRRVLRALPHPQDGPLFLYVHFNESHWPYYDEDAFLGGVYPGSGRLAAYSLLAQEYSGKTELEVEPEKLGEMVSRYGGEIKRVDRGLRGFFESLRKRGLWDNSLIIIVSDHGEEFLEHLLWGHGHSLYQELIHVPLLIKFPKGVDITPRVIDCAVNTIDIAPTILDFLGRADLGTQMEGNSLMPLIRGEKGVKPGLIFSERVEGREPFNIYATVQDSLKFILTWYEDGREKNELYNIVEDPGEKVNLWSQTEEFSRIKRRCENFIDSLEGEGFEGKSEFDSQTLEKLKAMGYLW